MKNKKRFLFIFLLIIFLCLIIPKFEYAFVEDHITDVTWEPNPTNALDANSRYF